MVVESVSSPQILQVDHPESFFYQADTPLELCGHIPDGQLSCQIVKDQVHGWQVVFITGDRAEVDIDGACTSITPDENTQEDCRQALKPLRRNDESVALKILSSGSVEFKRSVWFDEPSFDPLAVIYAVSASTTIQPASREIITSKIEGDVDYFVAGLLGFIVLFVSTATIVYARTMRGHYEDSSTTEAVTNSDTNLADPKDVREKNIIKRLLQSKKSHSTVLPTQKPGSKPFLDLNDMPRATPGVANRNDRTQ